MYYQLPFKPIKTTKSNLYKLRVLFYDVTELYKRITIKPYKRYQNHLTSEYLFPKLPNNLCDCGCNQELTGRRTRWATNDCQKFVSDVYSIIYGDTKLIGSYLKLYNDNLKCCSECGSTLKLEVDHLLGVSQGGGGLWLTNYSLKCKPCHRIKTNKDFNWKNKN